MKARCYVKECCTDRWTNHNVTNLLKAFNANLFGQHLVNHIVSRAVLNHVQNKNPKKALVMSFHGWTGSGKNYVADLIAKHVFREGTESQYVNKKIATLHYPHDGDLKHYKKDLKSFITRSVERCDRAMFVFDEMDKMPEGLSDVMKPYLDYHSNIENIDYRKSIFLFLSNTAGNKINKETLRHFQEGKSRESITNKQMESILSVASFNMEGGMKNSELILSGLVDFFIPFLPMERKHVLECAAASIRLRNQVASREVLEQIANELHYFPPGSNIYSKTGCKQVEKKVDGFL